MGLRSWTDPVPAGERAFILASTRMALQEGGTPVKVYNLMKPKGDAQNG